MFCVCSYPQIGCRDWLAERYDHLFVIWKCLHCLNHNLSKLNRSERLKKRRKSKQALPCCRVSSPPPTEQVDKCTSYWPFTCRLLWSLEILPRSDFWWNPFIRNVLITCFSCSKLFNIFQVFRSFSWLMRGVFSQGVSWAHLASLPQYFHADEVLSSILVSTSLMISPVP